MLRLQDNRKMSPRRGKKLYNSTKKCINLEGVSLNNNNNF